VTIKLSPDALTPRQPTPAPGTSTYELTLRDEAIARALASGYDRDKLMAYYELTPVGLRAVMGRIEPLVTRYRERFQIATQMNSIFAEQLAPRGLENVEMILNDPGHKDWAFTSRWIIEQVRAAKLDVNGGLSLEVSPQALDTIAKALAALVENKANIAPVVAIEHDPHLLPSPK